MGYDVEEQQLHEIEKDLRLIEENADVADSKLFSCLLDNANDLTLFAADPDQSLQQLADKVESSSKMPFSTRNQIKIPHEFDQLITHGYERLQEVYHDIKRYELLQMDNRQSGSTSANDNKSDDNCELLEGHTVRNHSNNADGIGRNVSSTTSKTVKRNGKENQRPNVSLGKIKPREEARLLNQLLKNNAMRRTMCPEPGRLPFKHDKQLKMEHYRREWAKNPPPGEQKRMALRWRIRELMMKREIPQLRIVTTEPFPEEQTTITE
ncbi:hypothetical protein niasHS_003388 [Heterodera schachtii]|uniref:Centriolar and ciliogenesis-associated protein HYLS1 C-terminal domain-containing protein n=1 Tax=Heterodera schachtii TaxID=97005 RepID=A0ABD2KHN4_HETSC